MPTGDLKGCLRKLESSLRSLKYPRDVDYKRLAVGDPSECLPIVSFVFTSFSPSVTESLLEYGVELTGMNDLRFIENVYKSMMRISHLDRIEFSIFYSHHSSMVLRDVFSYKPLLTKQQFLQFGFAERKISIICDVVGLVLNKHKELLKANKLANKPKTRLPSVICARNEIPLLESDSLGSAMVKTKPLVERHSGSRSALVQISRISDEEPVQEEKKLESDIEHTEEPGPTMSLQECVLESQLRAVEATLLESVGRLEQRLALVEHRVLALENSLAGKITIQSNQWENLESRVLLLETRLALTAQGPALEERIFHANHSEFKDDPVSSSDPCVIQHSCDVNVQTPPCSSTNVSQDFKERMERLVCMMKDTSNILQNVEPAT